MKYAKPEVEIMELDLVDVIQTSNGGEGGNTGGDLEDPSIGGNGTPIIRG